MSKYIPVDKLIAEIERRLKIVEPLKDTFESCAACRQELIWMKEYIDSLQQEQPEVELEKEITPSLVENMLCEFGVQSIEDVDSECLADIARHFYELGRLSNK